MGYSFDEHLHNYAVWTAARGVQRSFTTTQKIKKAIELSNLVYVNAIHLKTHAEFNEFHKVCSNQLIQELRKEKCTYGRAAKIIALYLKTSIVIPSKGKGNLSAIIHCPIDRILVSNLFKNKKYPFLKNVTWTTLSEKLYWNLVNNLVDSGVYPNWKLEKYWY